MKVSQPETTIQIVGGDTGIPETDHKVLFVGQQVAGGSAATGVLVEKIGISGQEDALFGANSDLAGMIRTARKYNNETRFDAIPLDDDGGGVAAEGTVTFTGPATAAGTITVVVGSRENHTYDLAIATGDSETDIAAALAAAITADTDAPFSAGSAIGAVTITASQAGTAGNFYGLEFSGDVAGVGVTLVAFAAGATDPDLTNLFDVIDGERYETIVWPTGYLIDTVKDFLDGRFNAVNEVLDGVAIVSVTDTLANLDALAAGHNSQSLVIHANRAVSELSYEGSALFELDNNIAATIAALRALRLTEDATLSDVIVVRGGLADAFGGPAYGSKPYFNTRARFLPQIDVARGFNHFEIEQLIDARAFVIGNNRARTEVVLGEVVTTYKTDGAGNADLSFKFLNQVDTMSLIREFYDESLRSRFAQSRLTDGDPQPGRAMANKGMIEGEIDRIYGLLSGPGFVLTRAGPDNVAFFKANRVVTLDLANGTVSFTAKVPIVTQLRQIIGTLQLQFDI